MISKSLCPEQKVPVRAGFPPCPQSVLSSSLCTESLILILPGGSGLAARYSPWPLGTTLQEKESGDIGPVVLDSQTPGADGEAEIGTSSCSRFPLLPRLRYAIDRSTDTERIFDIDANTGAIVTGKVLDRETAGWHNITVLAMEAGEMGKGRVGRAARAALQWGRGGSTVAFAADVTKMQVLINTEVKKKKCSTLSLTSPQTT